MTTNYIVLGPWQLILASFLIIINMLFSILLKLKLEKPLGIASFRMVSQLLLLGLILEWVFTIQEWWLILGLAIVMGGVAGINAVGRTKRRFKQIYWTGFLSILTASFLITGTALGGIIQIEPWFHPQYFFPILGMVLGNTLTGISLSLDRFMEEINDKRLQIESLLTLGATRWEAAHESVKEAVRAGMIPNINSMMVMGIVSLPGMMTGQILAGANPMDAIYYQIVIIFMIAAATSMGVIGVVLLTFFCLFNNKHRLCLHRLVLRKQ